MTYKYILDEKGEPRREDDVLKWAAWFKLAIEDGRPQSRRIAFDRYGDVEVSTVFLGLDHSFMDDGPPVLWETMVFGGPLDCEQDRYTSKADAILGHSRMLRRVMESGS